MWILELTINKNNNILGGTGLRLGWATGAPAVIEKLGHCVAGTSLGASSTSQASPGCQPAGCFDTVADDTSSVVVKVFRCSSLFRC